MSNSCQNLAKIKKGQFMHTSLFHRSYVGINHDKIYRYLTPNMSTTEFINFPIYLLDSLCCQSWLRVSLSNRYCWSSPHFPLFHIQFWKYFSNQSLHTITTISVLVQTIICHLDYYNSFYWISIRPVWLQWNLNTSCQN